METLHERSIGQVRVIAKSGEDTDPDLSYLGEWSLYRQPTNRNQKLVDRFSGAVLGHDGLWRDERGRIVAEPECHGTRGEYQYTWHDNGHDRIRYALRDHERLADYGSGWGMLVIGAHVYLNGAEIARAGVYGIESDSDQDYIRETVRDMEREAMRGARAWLQSVTKSR